MRLIVVVYLVTLLHGLVRLHVTSCFKLAITISQLRMRVLCPLD